MFAGGLRLALFVSFGLTLVGCEAAYESPCRATPPSLVIPAPPPPEFLLGIIGLPIQIQNERGGGIQALWVERAAGPPFDLFAKTQTIAAARISSEGETTDRARVFLSNAVPAFISWNGSRFLAVSVVSSSTTLELALIRREYSVRARAVESETLIDDGGPEIFACLCAYPSITVVPSNDGFLVLASDRENPPTVIQLDANGAVTSSAMFPRTLTDTACAQSVPRFDGTLIDLSSAGCTAALDTSFRLLGGPIELAGIEASSVAGWAPDGSSVALAYVQSAITFNDLFFMRRDNSGAPLIGPERIGDGLPIAIASDGDLFAIAFPAPFSDPYSYENGMSVAIVASDGAKLGGDVRVGPLSQYVGIGLNNVLFASSRARTFSLFVSDETGVSHGEVSCAPQ